MKPILEWVEKYLSNLPPQALKGGYRGAVPYTLLDVYGTDDRKSMKSSPVIHQNGPERAHKRSLQEINKTLIYMRLNHAKATTPNQPNKMRKMRQKNNRSPA